MRNLLRNIFWLLTFIWFSGCAKTEAKPDLPETKPAKATVIYVVRHAEKSNNSITDPDLSNAGKARAEALKNVLAKEPVTAIYSTNYKRTEQTGEPLALAKKLKIITYDAGNLKTLADKILTENINQTVLIVGHSNTILETIEALKVKRPVSEVTDSEYDYLFKVTIPENGTASAEALHYSN